MDHWSPTHLTHLKLLLLQALTDMQSRCLTIALTNYIRALQLGHLYDLPIVYRLCQLWFELSASDAVNRSMQYAFDCVPPAKFVPLTYQIASRISRVEDRAGFQTAVWTALKRLAVAHPFHTCYSLIALSNGNLGPQGRPQQAAASGRGQRSTGWVKATHVGMVFAALVMEYHSRSGSVMPTASVFDLDCLFPLGATPVAHSRTCISSAHV